MKVNPEIRLIIHPEHIPVRGNCSAIDEETDKATEEEILRRLEQGDIWAWCCVEVQATYGGVSASDFLGGCNYKNEKDFMQPGGYYDDMVSEACNALAEKIRSLVESLKDTEINVSMEPPRDADVSYSDWAC